ncbi:MAG: hypothetical protein IT337_02570 [Thermomicrobiales bacterium]|nr:hypothetical protein [Thermomicrobiales bacterium]
MDEERFDRLTRGMFAAASRRGALRTLLAGGFAAAAAVVVPGLAADAEERSATIKGCRPPGQRCSKNKSCCTGHCRKGACKCLRRGASCLMEVSKQLPPLPTKSLCCSSRCSRNTNVCR